MNSHVGGSSYISDCRSTFEWAIHLFRGFEIMLGRQRVVERLQAVQGGFTTMFSGMECAAQAVGMLQSIALERYGLQLQLKHDRMCEVNKHCRQLLLSNYSGNACLFGDVRELVDIPRGLKHIAKLQVRSHQPCYQHNGPCPVVRSSSFLDISGPPCVLFSKMGKKEGFQDDERSKCHAVYFKLIAEEGPKLAIHENVEGYPGEVLQRHLPGYEVAECTMNAKHFGVPMARKRCYRLLVRKGKMRWAVKESFQELYDKILTPAAKGMGRSGGLCAEDIFVKPGGPECEVTWTEKRREYLVHYKDQCPDVTVVDLSQNPRERPRATSVEELAPCFTRNTLLYSTILERFLTGTEMLAAMGLPVLPEHAATAYCEVFKTDGVTNAALMQMAGNAMHVPSVGFAILTALLCVAELD